MLGDKQEKCVEQMNRNAPNQNVQRTRHKEDTHTHTHTHKYQTIHTDVNLSYEFNTET
jgi:hypothetical protein